MRITVLGGGLGLPLANAFGKHNAAIINGECPYEEIDFKALRAASAQVGKSLKRGTLVVSETTVSVGGTRHYYHFRSPRGRLCGQLNHLRVR